MKKKKERLTITLSQYILEFIENNYSKKSRFIEYCIIKELEQYKKGIGMVEFIKQAIDFSNKNENFELFYEHSL
jgi:hypothetical protein